MNSFESLPVSNYDDLQVGDILVSDGADSYRVIAIDPKQLSVISQWSGALGVLDRFQISQGFLKKEN